MNDEINPYQSPPDSSAIPDEKAKSNSRKLLGGRLLTLATFVPPAEAHLFRNELELHGINAAIANEHTAILGTTMAGQTAAFTTNVMIMETDAEAALEIKKRWVASKKGAEEPEHEISEWTCSCGETVDAGFEICWNCASPFSPAENN